jgi:hypothetical protein
MNYRGQIDGLTYPGTTLPRSRGWQVSEGAVDVIEIYTAARILAATGDVLAAQATEDIERQMGGPIESRPEEYTKRTVVRRAEDIRPPACAG